MKPERAARTHQEYELSIRLYVVPFIGGIKLSRLNSRDISQWMADMARKDFTNHMRKRALRVLRNALNRAVEL